MSDKQTYPNAGPNCDLSRYRTGEAPMVGDKVRLHGDCINGVRDEWPTCKLTIQRVYRSGEVEFPVPHRSIEKRALYAARFDLISRAHSPDAGKMVDPAHEPTLIDPTVEPYEIGVRDGYQQAVQDIDILTGGDGEYYYSTDGGGCPGAEAMKAKIVERFTGASLSGSDAGKMVERMLYTGRNAAEIQAWAGRGGEFSLPADDTGMPLYVIERDDGSKVVIRPGDWVVREADGQLARESLRPTEHPAPEPTLLEAADTCFLLEDDEPSQHGKPIACTQCWNALSEMQRESASRAALLSVAANEYQALVDWIFKAGSPMPPENTTAHRIASLIRELQAKLRAKGGG